MDSKESKKKKKSHKSRRSMRKNSADVNSNTPETVVDSPSTRRRTIDIASLQPIPPPVSDSPRSLSKNSPQSSPRNHGHISSCTTQSSSSPAQSMLENNNNNNNDQSDFISQQKEKESAPLANLGLVPQNLESEEPCTQNAKKTKLQNLITITQNLDSQKSFLILDNQPLKAESLSSNNKEKSTSKHHKKSRKSKKKKEEQSQTSMGPPSDSTPDQQNHSSEQKNQSKKNSTISEQENNINEQANSINEQANNINEQANNINEQENNIKEQANNINEQENNIKEQENNINEQENNIKEQENNINEQENNINQPNTQLSESDQLLKKEKEPTKERTKLNLEISPEHRHQNILGARSNSSSRDSSPHRHTRRSDTPRGTSLSPDSQHRSPLIRRISIDPHSSSMENVTSKHRNSTPHNARYTPASSHFDSPRQGPSPSNSASTSPHTTPLASPRVSPHSRARTTATASPRTNSPRSRTGRSSRQSSRANSPEGGHSPRSGSPAVVRRKNSSTNINRALSVNSTPTRHLPPVDSTMRRFSTSSSLIITRSAENLEGNFPAENHYSQYAHQTSVNSNIQEKIQGLRTFWKKKEIEASSKGPTALTEHRRKYFTELDSDLVRAPPPSARHPVPPIQRVQNLDWSKTGPSSPTYTQDIGFRNRRRLGSAIKKPLEINHEDPQEIAALVGLQAVLHGALSRQLFRVEKTRRSIVEECLRTELNYMQDLKTLVQLYVLPSRSSELISGSDHAKLFGKIEEITHNSVQLVDDLNQAFHEWTPSSGIGQIIVDHIPRFQIYRDYVVELDNNFKLYNNLRQDQAFLMWEKKLMNDRRVQGQTINDFLILPFQRPPRWILLLESLKKSTAPTHPDYKELDSAINAVKRIVHAADRLKKNREDAQAVAAKYQLPDVLDSDARGLIKEGNIIVDGKLSHVLVFTDMIKFARNYAQKKWITIKLGPSFELFLPINHRPQKTHYAMRLHTEDRFWTFEALSKEEYSEWCEVLDEAVQDSWKLTNDRASNGSFMQVMQATLSMTPQQRLEYKEEMRRRYEEQEKTRCSANVEEPSSPRSINSAENQSQHLSSSSAEPEIRRKHSSDKVERSKSKYQTPELTTLGVSSSSRKTARKNSSDSQRSDSSTKSENKTFLTSIEGFLSKKSRHQKSNSESEKTKTLPPPPKSPSKPSVTSLWKRASLSLKPDKN